MSDVLPLEEETTAPRAPEAELKLEPVLAAHQQEVERLAKSLKRLGAAVRAWKKACVMGHMVNRARSAQAAVQQLEELGESAREAADSWEFDVQAYLESPEWRREVIEAARARHGMRVHDDEAGSQLLSTPVAVQAQPAREALRIGRASWPAIRPSAVADELKRLRDRLSESNSQEFLESLYAACQWQKRDDRLFITFRKAYELFCLAPGYRKENPRSVFGMQIYALHRSGTHTTRSGKAIQWEWPSGKPQDRDIFEVRAEDGRQLRFYGIWFR